MAAGPSAAEAARTDRVRAGDEAMGFSLLRAGRGYGGNGCPGGGGGSSGMVIGGSPGISTTVEPTGGGMPSGGGGGGGGMPLLTSMVTIEPGMVCPLGEVPTTAPERAVLLTQFGWSATWNPTSLSLARAASTSRPTTLGTRELGPPST